MPDALLIRPARAEDAEAIDRVHCAAFAATASGHQGEAELVRVLDADGDLLLSLLAERDGAVVGHVAFSRMDVEADGNPIGAAGLAPLAVLPAVQRLGIGEALVRAGLSELRGMGIEASFVLGDEGYYSRFGYSADLASRFASVFAGPHFMSLMLDSAAKWPLGGRADYASAFGRMG